MSDLKHIDNTGTCRFVTFSTHRRLPLLRDYRVCSIIVEELKEMRRTTGTKILGYVIMPEHLHLVLLPPDSWQLGIEVGKLKSRTASRIIAEQPGSLASFMDRLEIVRNHRHRLAIWTPRCFDRNLRNEVAVRTRIDYCHDNPVKRGLVTDPSDWVWSSFRWYQGRKDVPLVIDELCS